MQLYNKQHTDFSDVWNVHVATCTSIHVHAMYMFYSRIHCTMYSVRVQYVQCTVYGCNMYNVQCTCAICTMYSVRLCWCRRMTFGCLLQSACSWLVAARQPSTTISSTATPTPASSCRPRPCSTSHVPPVASTVAWRVEPKSANQRSAKLAGGRHLPWRRGGMTRSRVKPKINKNVTSWLQCSNVTAHLHGDDDL